MVDHNVNQEEKDKLADLFTHLSGSSWWEVIHDDPERAMIAVNEIIKAGWVPKNTDDTWVITYSKYGIFPRREEFATEEEAVVAWDKLVDDPELGDFVLKQEVIHRRKPSVWNNE